MQLYIRLKKFRSPVTVTQNAPNIQLFKFLKFIFNDQYFPYLTSFKFYFHHNSLLLRFLNSISNNLIQFQIGLITMYYKLLPY